MKTQDEIRGKFEKLEEIADKLEHLFFEDGFYFRKYDDADSDEYFVNGAWYAFQEKQEKIDEALAEISRAMKCCESIETECVLTEIKGVLK